MRKNPFIVHGRYRIWPGIGYLRRITSKYSNYLNYQMALPDIPEIIIRSRYHAKVLWKEYCDAIK